MVAPPASPPATPRIGSPTTSKRVGWSVVILAVLAVLWTAYFAKPLLLPIVIAFLVKILLTPVVRWLRRIGVPAPLGALVALALALGGVGFLVVEVTPAAAVWAERLPERLQDVERKLWDLREPVKAISDVTTKVGEKVEDIAAVGDNSAVQRPAATVVRIEESSVGAAVFSHLRAFLYAFFFVLALAYLLLAADGHVMTKLMSLPSLAPVQGIQSAVQSIERRVGIYIVTVLAINATLGLVLSLALWAVGMPSPLLWGLVAGTLNIVPYLGPFASLGLLTLVAMTEFPHWSQAVVPPAIYLGLHTLESFIVTPITVGRWLVLSPVAIFVWLMIMGFLWGISGLLLAIPLLVMLKIAIEQFPALRMLDAVIGGSPTATPRIRV